MEDLSQFRLVDYEEIMVYIREDRERFFKFLNRVYKVLMDMPPGSKKRIRSMVKEPDIPVLIKVICNCIREGGRVYFTEDFEYIVRCKESTGGFKVYRDVRGRLDLAPTPAPPAYANGLFLNKRS